jgi:hypothetical protein
VPARAGPEAEVELMAIDTDEEAQRLRFPGSPTIRVDGRDLFPCRIGRGTRSVAGCTPPRKACGVRPPPRCSRKRRSSKGARVNQHVWAVPPSDAVAALPVCSTAPIHRGPREARIKNRRSSRTVACPGPWRCEGWPLVEIVRGRDLLERPA